MDEFKFEINDTVKTNKLFDERYIGELPFKGVITLLDYATVLGEKVPYVTVDGRKTIPQEYLEKCNPGDPFDDVDYRNGLFKLNEHRKAVFAEYMIAKAEADELKKELDGVDEDIVKFKEGFGIYQNVR